jgi:hypothetical protein
MKSPSNRTVCEVIEANLPKDGELIAKELIAGLQRVAKVDSSALQKQRTKPPKRSLIDRPVAASGVCDQGCRGQEQRCCRGKAPLQNLQYDRVSFGEMSCPKPQRDHSVVAGGLV